MLIRKIDTDSQTATVTFDYDELRCLCNSMSQLSSCKFEKDKDFNNVYAKTIELFSLVKHCMIPEFELKEICKLLFDTEQPIEKGGE
jgi:hypothetical protein